MIVPMKKVTLVCLESDRDDALRRLRELGVLHLVPYSPPQGADLEQTQRALARAKQALIALTQAAPETATAATFTPPAPTSGDALVAAVEQALAKRQAINDEQAALRQEARRLEPFGDFDPERIRALAARGLAVRLFRESIQHPMALPDGAVRIVLNTAAPSRAIAIVGQAPLDVHGEELALPAQSLGAARRHLDALNADAASVSRDLAALAQQREALVRHIASLEADVQMLQASGGMGRTGSLAYLRGFCPTDRTAGISEGARHHGWGLTIVDPAPGEAVPTQLRYARWVLPIRSLFEMINILPGYREVDVSPSFFLFLILFFALIVGDAGYGALFLIITFVAQLKAKRAPRDPFILFYLFSTATIVWGVLTGTYFGLTQIALPIPVFQHLCAWLNVSKNVIHLCLVIGGVHLTVAHGWNVIRYGLALPSLAQLGWIALTWTLFFAARTMLVGIPFPSYGLGLGGAGLLAIILFMTPLSRFKAEWINHAMLPLSIMSGFGDILSYLRLFALGVAGVQLGMAFDMIAGNIGFDSLAHIAIASLVLIVGHSLNLVLCALSVLVHGVRLNALEFSMHMGLEWSGSPYRPFARQEPLRPGVAPAPAD